MTGGPHRGFLCAVLVLSGYAPSMDKSLFECGQIQQALFLLLPLNKQTYPLLFLATAIPSEVLPQYRQHYTTLSRP